MEKAVLRLAAAVVSPIFTKLGDKAASYFGGDVTKKELQHLQNVILPKILHVLSVAEAVPVRELKPWLRTLQDAAYKAEDVLDMYEYKCLEAEVSPPNLLKKYKKKAKDFFAPLSFKTELKKSFEKLQMSVDEADKFILHYGINCQIQMQQQQQQPSTGFPPSSSAVQQQQRTTTSSLPPSSVFGRDKERDLLVGMLTSTSAVEHSGSQRHTPVLAICGLGGAGKTTLAQSVYNDSRVVKHFGTRVWVHVSRKFDVESIATQIIESVTRQGEASNKFISLDALLMRLKDVLKSKKFLLVLDDVWCQDLMQWDQMLDPLNEVEDTAGSRILVTTREQQLASKLGIKKDVPLKDLEYEHCMSIFKYYSFGDANEVIHDQELATVAGQIIEKLKMSPLSARMVGSLLRGKKKVVEWKNILQKGEMLIDTLDALYLSFDNLAPYLQHCFVFCSLFPKGSHFKVGGLVKLWMAQGFVEAPKEDEMTMEDIGNQYFDELVCSSFFQKDIWGGYVIHDLLHDLAQKVSKDLCFRIEDDSKDIPTTVRHLSISSTKYLLPHIKSEIFKLVNLRTFMIIGNYSYDSIDIKSKIFNKFKKLRVLHLGNNRLLLHKTIGQLKHIRYLHGRVKEVKRLPKSLGRLYHVQFLNFGEGEIIPKISFFGKLTFLQSIGMEYSASRKKGHRIEQLKNLRHLRGSLHINNLENVRSKEEASNASLEEKKLLEELTLKWTCSPPRDGRIDEEVIKALEPPPNLNVLKIEGYNGIEFPEWSFLRLSGLAIKNCLKLKLVPSLPRTLKRLEVYGCWNLNEMPSLPSGLRVIHISVCPTLMQLSPFPPNLEGLEIWKCPGAETLLSNMLVFEGEDEQPNNQKQKEEDDQQQQQQHFPLKYLCIDSCSVSGKKRLFSDPNKLFTSLTKLELGGLPWLTSLFHPDHKLTSLNYLEICDCENLELFWSPLASISPSLRHLIIGNCPRLTMPYTDGSFLLPSSVEELEFINCGDPEMNLLGRCLLGLTSLTTLKIGGYSRARSLPDLPNPGAIKKLWVGNCRELTSMWDLQPFSSLTDLYIGSCSNLTSFPANMENLSSLTKLYIEECPEIELLPNFPPSLQELTISECHPYLQGESLRQELRHIPYVHVTLPDY